MVADLLRNQQVGAKKAPYFDPTIVPIRIGTHAKLHVTWPECAAHILRQLLARSPSVDTPNVNCISTIIGYSNFVFCLCRGRGHGVMDSIPWMAPVYEFTPIEQSLVTACIIVACLATGFVIDAIMRDSGLGPAPNGVLAFAGVSRASICGTGSSHLISRRSHAHAFLRCQLCHYSFRRPWLGSKVTRSRSVVASPTTDRERAANANGMCIDTKK
jgi:hypothetical protein